jgi:ABC-type amino acid transport substrate-binding protein
MATSTGERSSVMQRVRSMAACAIALLSLVAPTLAQRAAAPPTTLDRIRTAGSIKVGYRTDARPFSFQGASGADGYSVALCTKVVDALKADLGLAALTVEWVPVTVADRFQAVQQGQVDLLCGAETVTLERRRDVGFSIPIFPGGVGALLRTDAPPRLREILNERPRSDPAWRGSAGQLLQAQTFSVVTGTTAEPWLARKLTEFKLTAKVEPVDGYDGGIQGVLDRKANVFFGDRAILLDAARRHPSSSKLVVLDRLFTYEPVALAFARGDEDFRLAVDRALSAFYASGELSALYAQWFGAADDDARSFFRWNALR